jgi:hypothetical protein
MLRQLIEDTAALASLAAFFCALALWGDFLAH